MEKHKPALDTLPVLIASGSAVHATEILLELATSHSVFAVEVKDLVEGLRSLANLGQGVLAVNIETKKEFQLFYKALVIVLKATNVAGVRIAVFSASHEILDSRALAQFQFIRCYQRSKNIHRMADLVFSEMRSLQTSLARMRARTGRLSVPLRDSAIMVIRDSQLRTPVALNKKASPPKQDIAHILRACVGERVPTYLYNVGLDWRVRGHFASLDENPRLLKFHAASEPGAMRLSEYLRGQNQLFSSSGSAQGRVLCSLEALGTAHSPFVFRYPQALKFLQRRRDERRRVPMDLTYMARVAAPRLRGTHLFTIYDYSAGGVGLWMDAPTAKLFGQGDKIKNVVVYLAGREMLIPALEVRHISRTDADDGRYVVGVSFTSLAPKDSAILEMLVFTATI